MAEGEGAQERPQGRGRGYPAAEQPAGLPRPQHVGVIDRVGAEHHRVDQRHHLAPGVGGARQIAWQSHHLPGEGLEPETLRQCRDQRHTGA